MAVQVLSALHLEAPKSYDIFEIVPKTPYLALLGDMGNIASHKDECLGFLTRQLNQFRAVLFVPGNHEAYGSNWPATLDILCAFEVDVRKDSSLGDLFSFIPPESQMAVSLGLNDFFQTSDWDVGMHNKAHKRDLAWLNAQVAELEQSDVKIMIFSHWSPSLDVRVTEPRHAGSPITSAFSTELSDEACFKSDKVKIWAFGHTHYNCDFTVEREGDAGRLRLLANQRGYYFAQAEGYDGEKTVESIDFVIPDSRLSVGTKSLTQFKSLTPCPDQEVCPSSSHERHTPPPAFHIHMEDSEVTVALYLQSETLWFLPPLDSSLSISEKLKLPPQFILASDQTVLPPWRPGRGSGVFMPGCDPVVVPKSHILLEAFLRLFARDLGKRIGSFAIAMIGYMEEYVDDDGLLDANQLPEPLKTSYKELRQGMKPVRQWRKELGEALGILEDDSEDDHV